MERKNEDNLNFSQDRFILRIIKLETLLFSDQITKINEYDIPQERNIIITTQAVYNLKIKELKRRIPLVNIIGITISNNTMDDFVIHGRNQEYDYYYSSDKRKKIIETINSAWKQLNSSLDLTLCRVNDISLRNYVTESTDKKRDKNISRMPIPAMKCSMKAYLNEASNPHKRHWKHQIQTQLENESESQSESIKNEIKEGPIRLIERQLGMEFTPINLSNYRILRLIKQGHYSKVYLAEYKYNNQSFAIKVFRKDNIIDQDLIDNILVERHILSSSSNNNNQKFLCFIEMIFQSPTRIYFVMPFIPNGELFDFIKRLRTIPEDYVRFISAQIALALQSLHDIHIIYRDLKPENILFDIDGYIKIIDFGLSKVIQGDEKAMSFVGTPEFLAPEVITGDGHTKGCDWWSLGVLIYQMLFGVVPFYNQNIETMYELIRTAPLKFPKKVKISEAAVDLLEKLLQKNPSKRLGTIKGFQEVKLHPFFKGIDFERLNLKIIPPPYRNELIEVSDMGDAEEYIESDIEEAGMNKIRLNEALFEDVDLKNYQLK